MTTDDDLMRLADIVRERRQAKGLTQKQLAARVGAHEQTIGNLERGKTATDPSTLARIGKVLDLDLSSPAAVAATRTLTDTANAVTAEMIARADGMTLRDQIIFFGDVMTYVTEWEPSTRRG